MADQTDGIGLPNRDRAMVAANSASSRRCSSVCKARLAVGLGLALLVSVAAAEESSTQGPSHGKLWVSPVNFVECASETAFARGDIVMLTGSGFAADETIEITLLQGDSERPVASAKANKIGALSTRVAIPADAASGQEAHFRATGKVGADSHGMMLNSTLLQIFADGRDSDGDGFKDMCDDCPNVANEDLFDDDGDGQGNVCDKCPTDPENDVDGDGLCADDDPDPLTP